MPCGLEHRAIHLLVKGTFYPNSLHGIVLHVNPIGTKNLFFLRKEFNVLALSQCLFVFRRQLAQADEEHIAAVE